MAILSSRFFLPWGSFKISWLFQHPVPLSLNVLVFCQIYIFLIGIRVVISQISIGVIEFLNILNGSDNRHLGL